MSETEKTYTYRGGRKVELEKSTDQMIVRALPILSTIPLSQERISSASGA